MKFVDINMAGKKSSLTIEPRKVTIVLGNDAQNKTREYLEFVDEILNDFRDNPNKYKGTFSSSEGVITIELVGRHERHNYRREVRN